MDHFYLSGVTSDTREFQSLHPNQLCELVSDGDDTYALAYPPSASREHIYDFLRAQGFSERAAYDATFEIAYDKDRELVAVKRIYPSDIHVDPNRILH